MGYGVGEYRVQEPTGLQLGALYVGHGNVGPAWALIIWALGLVQGI